MPEDINNENLDTKKPVSETENSGENPTNTSEETTAKTEPKTKINTEKSFSEKWKTSHFWLIRGSYKVFSSVWTIVLVVGGLIAWLVALLFI